MLKIRKSTGILIVVIFATMGYYFTYLAVNNQTVEYSCVEPYLYLRVKDHSQTKDTANTIYSTFRIKVNSKLPLDKVATSAVPDGTEIKMHPVLYHQNPSLLVWMTLICIMVTFAAGSFPVFLFQLLEIKKCFNLGWWKVMLSLVYSFILIFFLYMTSSGEGLNGYFTPVGVIKEFKILFKDARILEDIVRWTILLLVPCLSTVFLTALSADKIMKQPGTFDNLQKNVRNLAFLNTSLNIALQVLAVVVVFSSLTSNALGASIRAVIELENFQVYPKEVSFVYGAYLSVFLGIIYVPVYFYLQQQYNQMKVLSAQMKAAGIPGQYDTLFPATVFTSSAVDNLKLALTVLAPLLTTLLPKDLF